MSIKVLFCSLVMAILTLVAVLICPDIIKRGNG